MYIGNFEYRNSFQSIYINLTFAYEVCFVPNTVN